MQAGRVMCVQYLVSVRMYTRPNMLLQLSIQAYDTCMSKSVILSNFVLSPACCCAWLFLSRPPPLPLPFVMSPSLHLGALLTLFPHLVLAGVPEL